MKHTQEGSASRYGPHSSGKQLAAFTPSVYLRFTVGNLSSGYLFLMAIHLGRKINRWISNSHRSFPYFSSLSVGVYKYICACVLCRVRAIKQNETKSDTSPRLFHRLFFFISFLIEISSSSNIRVLISPRL